LITVIDLKIGNINSVSRALKYIGIKHQISDNISEISQSEKIILPGVGNFIEAARRMRHLGLDDVLKEMVLDNKVPILGICLGMQLLASFGEEGGGAQGLDFIKGRVVYHRASMNGLRLPHIGWNEVDHCNIKLFDAIPNKSCFYFVHSYEFVLQESVKVGYTNYGVDFVSVVQKDHIIGTQFHPEYKSRPIAPHPLFVHFIFVCSSSFRASSPICCAISVHVLGAVSPLDSLMVLSIRVPSISKKIIFGVFVMLFDECRDLIA